MFNLLSDHVPLGGGGRHSFEKRTTQNHIKPEFSKEFPALKHLVWQSNLVGKKHQRRAFSPSLFPSPDYAPPFLPPLSLPPRPSSWLPCHHSLLPPPRLFPITPFPVFPIFPTLSLTPVGYQYFRNAPTTFPCHPLTSPGRSQGSFSRPELSGGITQHNFPTTIPTRADPPQ